MWLLFVIVFFVCFSVTEARINLTAKSDEWIWHPVPELELNIRKQHWTTFKVKAVKNAYFGLQTYYNSTDEMTSVYFAIYGSTCGVKIVGVSYSLINTHCTGILSTEEFRPLWVSWDGGLIAAGRGAQVGEDVIMSVDSPYSIDVHFLAVNSYQIDAEFIVDDFEDDNSELYCSLLAANAFYNPNPRMLTSTEVAFSTIHCSSMCLRTVWCRGFSYNTSQQQCRIFQSTPRVQDLTQESDWETWKLKPKRK